MFQKIIQKTVIAILLTILFIYYLVSIYCISFENHLNVFRFLSEKLYIAIFRKIGWKVDRILSSVPVKKLFVFFYRKKWSCVLDLNSLSWKKVPTSSKVLSQFHKLTLKWIFEREIFSKEKELFRQNVTSYTRFYYQSFFRVWLLPYSSSLFLYSKIVSKMASVCFFSLFLKKLIGHQNGNSLIWKFYLYDYELHARHSYRFFSYLGNSKCLPCGF